ncbi:MAG: EF-P lysine aminoacylase GenX [Chitinivibrionales bacterium]|nr:EF-P lysine aminoacylase GenX [Chitinivibrionales bacterium]
MIVPFIAGQRSVLYSKVRSFFSQRSVLEVDTPALSRAVSTDYHIDVFSTSFAVTSNPPAASTTCYLHTSPEFFMKRLLSAGYPDIFQICKVFRNGEKGRHHNPEFTMLEWYRRDFSMHQLMDEVAQLCCFVADTAIPLEKKIYKELFYEHVGLDPLTATVKELCAAIKNRGFSIPSFNSKTDLMQLIMALYIEPKLPANKLSFVYHFPAPQAVLATIDRDDPRVANRFELYWRGMEIGNGFEELADWQENQRRLEEENRKRAAGGKDILPVDHRFLDALKQGIPACSGVAVGLDRLLMIILGIDTIEGVLTFPWQDC